MGCGVQKISLFVPSPGYKIAPMAGIQGVESGKVLIAWELGGVGFALWFGSLEDRLPAAAARLTIDSLVGSRKASTRVLTYAEGVWMISKKPEEVVVVPDFPGFPPDFPDFLGFPFRISFRASSQGRQLRP
jgi:hypothetical protein